MKLKSYCWATLRPSGDCLVRIGRRLYPPVDNRDRALAPAKIALSTINIKAPFRAGLKKRARSLDGPTVSSYHVNINKAFKILSRNHSVSKIWLRLTIFYVQVAHACIPTRLGIFKLNDLIFNVILRFQFSPRESERLFPSW